MITVLFGLLAAQSSFLPQPKPQIPNRPRIPQGAFLTPKVFPGQPGWNPSKMTPEQFAQAADLAFKNLRGVSADTNCQMQFTTGRGLSLGRIFIRDQANFSIEYPFVTSAPKDFEKQTLMSYKGKFGIFMLAGWRKKGSLANRPRLLPAKSFAAWPWWGGRFLFAGIGTHERPIAQLVREARSAGIRSTVEDRSLIAGGKRVSLRRLLMTKPNGMQYEITSMANLGLPVTFRTSVPMKGGKVQKTVFALRWNLSPGQSFPDEAFALVTK